MLFVSTVASLALFPDVKLHGLNSQRISFLNPTFTSSLSKLAWGNHSVREIAPSVFTTGVPTGLKLTSRIRTSLNCGALGGQDALDFDWEDQELGDVEDLELPWEGAIVYKRNPSVSHLEYCTTLERLGLGNFSTDVSRSRASSMGLRVTKAVKDFPLGTPVQISVDVTRKKQKLRLDGIIRTVLTLACNRCGKPAAECVYSNFSLLLTEEPIQEPEVINMGVLFGEGKNKTFAGNGEAEEENEDDDALIDLDDRLHFPYKEKEIDISKPIRDLVHVEITITAVCASTCRGLCLKCGTNLNTSNCSCSKQQVVERVFGPLGDLRKQIQKTPC